MTSIIYVDDESGLLHLCKRYLEQNGDFTVDIAESAQAALEKMQTITYDAIVSDYQMPGMDGIRFLKTLRSSGDTTPFIIFTGRGREEVVIEALNSGADSYLQKGGEPRSQFAELIHMIETAVMHHHEKYALEESEKKYRDFFKTSRDAVFITALEGEIVDVSTSFIEMSGYDSREELLSVNVAELYENPDERRTHIRIIIEQGYTKEYPINLRKKDGAIISTLVTSVPRKDADGNALGFQGTIRDITEQKRADETLRESEATYRGLFNTIRQAIFIHDAEARIIDINEGALAMFGYSREEFIGRIPEFLPAPGRHDFNSVMDKIHLAFSGIPQQLELWAGRKNGEVFLNDIRLCKGVYFGQDVLIAIATDITRHKQAEDALRESEDKFRSLFENMAAGICIDEVIYDGGRAVDYRILDVNSAYEKILGISRSQAIGALESQLYGTAKAPYLDIYSKIAETGEPATFEAYFEPAQKYLQITASCPARGRFSTAFIDITDRKRVEDAIRQSEEKFRSVLENMPDLVLVHRNGNIVYVNPAMIHTMGYTPDEVLNTSIFNYIAPGYSESVSASLRKRMIAGKLEPYEIEVFSKTGERRIVVVSATMIEFGGLPAILNVLTDITERKQAEEALMQANKKLNLLSSITRHDILNGVAVLKGYIELAGDEVQNPGIQEYFDHMDHAVKTIHHQIEFAREYQEIGVKEAKWQNVRDTVQKTGTVFKMENVTLTITCGNIEIFADPLLQKVFYNLFENSFRYAPPFTTITISCTETGGDLSVVFEDNGAGIPEDARKHLFEHGFGENTGLGLFLSREILAITGITIMENGEPGKGARFEMTVPKGKFRFSGT